MNQKRMIAALEKKMSHSVGYRADLEISDVRRINKTAAHFMLAYEGDTPSTDDIGQFFVRKFNAKITPLVATARVYGQEKVLTIVAQILNVARDFDDYKKMTPVITGAVYLDVPLQETWEVKDRGEGGKVLVRKVKDDIMAMVQARRAAMMDTTEERHKTFAKLATTTSNLLRYLAIVEKGDVVKVYHDGMILDDASVTNVSEDEVKVKKGDKMYTVPRQAVIEVTERKKESDKAENDKVVDYFEKAYGDPNYSHKMTGK